MAQWAAGSESGILRKNKLKDNHDDLLVFGYACKVFRDDEKASYVDKGEHLIPWMGDSKLKIDRYDCRGALSDITPYEASREGFDAMRWLGLNENERRLEQMCDKERYHSLQINEEEEQMYKEEELKRQKTNEFQYSYDVPTNPEEKEMGPASAPDTEEEDEEYSPAPSLDVPLGVQTPKTVKENARIEKTALFVCKQGPQMEILIKAKQADNPQFGFLIQSHPLYKYYRHVLSAIKSGRYQVVTKTKAEESGENTDNAGDDHYLHPSLMTATTTAQSDVLQQTTTSSSMLAPLPSATASVVPQPIYKPSADCAYFQLVNRIQGVGVGGNNNRQSQPIGTQQQQPQPPAPGGVISNRAASAPMTSSGATPDFLVAQQQQRQQQQQQQMSSSQQHQQQIQQMTQEQQQQYYQQYYYASQQYYEYYKQLTQYQQQSGQPPGNNPSQQLDQANVQNYIQQMATYVQYMQQQQQQQQTSNVAQQNSSNNNSTNPYAQIVTNLSNAKDVTDSNNPYAGLLANLQQMQQAVAAAAQQPKDISKEPVIYGATNSSTNSSDKDKNQKETSQNEAKAQASEETVTGKKKPLLSLLAQYGSDNSDDSDSDSDQSTDGGAVKENGLGNKETKHDISSNKKSPDYKIPCGEVQIVIDKMASYVAKNGEQFEQMIRLKGDPRFEFLKQDNEFHRYYLLKLGEFKKVDEQPSMEEKIIKEEVESKPKQEPQQEEQPEQLPTKEVPQESAEMAPQALSKPKEKKVIAPVCFSIKKPKEDPPKEIKSALPLEESTDEEEDTNTGSGENEAKKSEGNPQQPQQQQPQPPQTSATAVISETGRNKDLGKKENGTSKNQASESQISNDSGSSTGAPKINGIFDITDDPILEMIDLTDDLEERKDARRAEDKIKDKIAAAAREKMASAARDRALQLERKRKAAAFLKLKSAESAIIAPAAIVASVPEMIKSEETAEKEKSENSSDKKALKSENCGEKKSGEKEKKSGEKEKKSGEKSDDKSEKSSSQAIEIVQSNNESTPVMKKEKRSRKRSRSRSKSREKRANKEVVQIVDDSGDETSKRRKSSKKKKSHKRKHSKSKHDSRSKKKSKKKHRRSDSSDSASTKST